MRRTNSQLTATEYCSEATGAISAHDAWSLYSLTRRTFCSTRSRCCSGSTR